MQHVVDHIIRQGEQGWLWIPALEDRRGRRVPKETLKELRACMEPYMDNMYVKACSYTVDHMLQG